MIEAKFFTVGTYLYKYNLTVLFVSPSKIAHDKFYIYCPPLLLNEIYAHALERLKNGCPPTFTIQPDRTGEDLQGGMAEDPQIQVWKTCCIFPKKTHGCIKSKGCFY